MKRDLESYQNFYLNQPFERYQVSFRKGKLLEILKKFNHRKLLEIGCGLEPLFSDLTTYEKFYVVEPAELFFENAKSQLFDNNNRNVTLFNSLLEDCEEILVKYDFDFIIASSILHEIVDTEKFLKVIYNISNCETVIHINVPNSNSFHRLLALEMGIINTVEDLSHSNIQFQQKQVFDIIKLTNLVKKVGFEIIESGSYSFKPFTHHQMQALVDHNIITEDILNSLSKMTNYFPDYGSEIYVNLRKVK
jgi:SAM-dependent methyltransferase